METPDTSAPLSAFPGATPRERLAAWAAARMAERFTPAELEELNAEASKIAHARTEMRNL
jgi:hypothetical protein